MAAQMEIAFWLENSDQWYEMKANGAYYGSFVIRFVKEVKCRRWTFRVGQTWCSPDGSSFREDRHQKRAAGRMEDAKRGENLDIDDSVIPADSYEFVAHYPTPEWED